MWPPRCARQRVVLQKVRRQGGGTGIVLHLRCTGGAVGGYFSGVCPCSRTGRSTSSGHTHTLTLTLAHSIAGPRYGWHSTDVLCVWPPRQASVSQVLPEVWRCRGASPSHPSQCDGRLSRHSYCFGACAGRIGTTHRARHADASCGTRCGRGVAVAARVCGVWPCCQERRLQVLQEMRRPHRGGGRFSCGCSVPNSNPNPNPRSRPRFFRPSANASDGTRSAVADASASCCCDLHSRGCTVTDSQRQQRCVCYMQSPAACGCPVLP